MNRFEKAVLSWLLLFCLLLPIAGCRPSAEDGTPTEQSTDEDRDSESADGSVSGSNEKNGDTESRQTAEISLPALRLFVGDDTELEYTVNAAAEGDLPIEWTSSTDCVKVDQHGRVTALKDGYAVVSAGGEKVCAVSVLPLHPAVMNIETRYGAEITSKEEYLECTVSVTDENEEYSFSGATAGIRIRGNTTADRPKKPYRIKFDKKQGLLGMNGGAECKSWVLLAEYQDASMIRNAVSLTLADVMIEEYSSDFRYVSVYINGKYNGVYLAAEQNQINPHRVNIPEANSGDGILNAGYLMEMDSNKPVTGKYLMNFSGYAIRDYWGNQYTVNTAEGYPAGYQFYSFKNDLNVEQEQFIESYLENVFQIIADATYYDEFCYLAAPDSLKPYRSGTHSAEEVISQVIDVDSFVRMYLLEELTHNGDSKWKSFFFFVDFSENGTGKLTCVCPWDFDAAYVWWNTYNFYKTEEYCFAKKNVWFVMLMNHGWFRERVAQIWEEILGTSDSFANAYYLLERVTATYQAEFAADAEKWPRGQVQSTQASLTEEWLKKRIQWLSGECRKF